jgi:hypothetical protein
MSRRAFFWMAGARAGGPRDIVRAGALGAIRFCRVSDRSLQEAALAIAGRDAVVEVDPSATTGMALLGSRATLVLDHGAWRLFSPIAL